MKDIIKMLEEILAECKSIDGQPTSFGFEAAVHDKTQELHDILFGQ